MHGPLNVKFLYLVLQKTITRLCQYDDVNSKQTNMWTCMFLCSTLPYSWAVFSSTWESHVIFLYVLR